MKLHDESLAFARCRSVVHVHSRMADVAAHTQCSILAHFNGGAFPLTLSNDAAGICLVNELADALGVARRYAASNFRIFCNERLVWPSNHPPLFGILFCHLYVVTGLACTPVPAMPCSWSISAIEAALVRWRELLSRTLTGMRNGSTEEHPELRMKALSALLRGKGAILAAFHLSNPVDYTYCCNAIELNSAHPTVVTAAEALADLQLLELEWQEMLQVAELQMAKQPVSLVKGDYAPDFALLTLKAKGGRDVCRLAGKRWLASHASRGGGRSRPVPQSHHPMCLPSADYRDRSLILVFLRHFG